MHVHQHIEQCCANSAAEGVLLRVHHADLCVTFLQVANREYRRLKKSNEHHPGYAMSRAYLETLADLPWNTFSGQAASDKSDPSKEGKVASSCTFEKSLLAGTLSHARLWVL